MQRNDWMKRIESGDVPHAILFAGPKESGQLALARHAAARYLLHTDDVRALSGCPFYMEPTDYQVRAVRDALAILNSQAYERGRHCILFADAHTMSEAAQDVLLKTLEEPPEDTLLLLTGSEAGFRPTILSRCMVLRAETEPWETIRDRLMQNGVGRTDATLAAKLSDGVYGRAEAFLDASYRTFRSGALDCVKALLKRAKPYAALAALCTETVEEENEDGAAKKTKKVSPALVDAFLDVLLSVLTDALRLKSGSGEICNTDFYETEKNFVSAFTTAQIQGMIQIAADAKEMLFYKANPAMTVDWILAKLP
ncbi:MAG: hypothetical protein IJJ86_05405 [Clostridia bacterium]|nr:hypothetical protein [Clostridia bacterium]